ncbi:MAG TPA: hypothetical protein DCY88_19505 [Cyanobacteria bacterium UBA11372]|nr:hypothetical protein [Cyanobacteria bacterium UBA11372]
MHKRSSFWLEIAVNSWLTTKRKVEESNLYSIMLHAGIPNQLPSTQPHFPKNFRFEIEDCRFKATIKSKI